MSQKSCHAGASTGRPPRLSICVANARAPCFGTACTKVKGKPVTAPFLALAFIHQIGKPGVASLRGRNASDTLTTARKRNSELLTVLGPTNWRFRSRINLGKKWRESWSPREREEAEAVTDTPECPDGMSLTLSCQAKLKASRR